MSFTLSQQQVDQLRDTQHLHQLRLFCTTFDHFMRRIDGVQVARTYVMVDYDVPAEALDAATALTPGLEAPTVSPLSKDGWYAVRAMVPRTVVQGLMDQLWDAGARVILSTELSACRL